MAKKYDSVLVYRAEQFEIAELPKTEIPVTLNFDRLKVVGKAILRFDGNMNIIADIKVISNSCLFDFMKPAVSMMTNGETQKVMGISITTENLDPFIGTLGNRT